MLALGAGSKSDLLVFRSKLWTKRTELFRQSYRITRMDVAHRDHRKITPADFRHLFAHANDALGPIEQRIRDSAVGWRR